MEGGHIAVIASMVTLAQGGVEVSSYSASKYALNSFLTCFRQ
jgi:short-subunit dehydrogenase